MKEKERRRETAGWLWGIFAIAGMAAAAAFSAQTAEAVRQGISLCGRVLLPALFPLSVLCRFAVKTGTAEGIGRRMGRITEKLLGISGVCGSAVAAGILCGFPAGAAMLGELRKRGEISDKETAVGAVAAGVGSPAFLIGIAGGGARNGGLLFWGVQVLSSLFSAALVGRLLRVTPSVTRKKEERAYPSPLSALAASLGEASASMIPVCGAVIFFSVPAGAVGLLGLPPLGNALLTGFLELTSGIRAAASLPGRTAVIASALLAGWNGLSVHGQVLSVTEGRLCSGWYFSGRLLAALFAALLQLMLCLCFF